MTHCCFVDANVQKLKPLAFYFAQELTKLQGIPGLKIVFLLYLIVKMDKYWTNNAATWSHWSKAALHDPEISTFYGRPRVVR